ncbi:MAG: hypothetical protein M9921_13075 [Fimbriimonadaceae bacterium]|nr:hypothetical protein [Fimbriimonadaceae bacterium]
MLEAKEDGLALPSVAALDRAEEGLISICLRLTEQMDEERIPIVVAVVTEVGGIEIVGYFHGIRGRYTARIDQDGACLQLTTTREF